MNSQLQEIIFYYNNYWIYEWHNILWKLNQVYFLFDNTRIDFE